ncbi:large-conductance mechanosensitive channel protein MscL [Nonlabens ponticola]|uniref:Large-conductance mechanosensitive channel n=1 Tax=Nonlabens ponticola TaxID=2496866 RepID=A0A3S9MVF3_9FLAO|nr:large-conductance mechanosensitive channel protein MscL [Nonlabens ponticola]AZQ43191.1 large-conductance mechanosensitive channel protein MscL [Nonlabens ponticola]
MLKEFKNFIMTGNVVDLAIAVIMAGAISAVVKGFVNFIMMPIVGYLTGGVDFADLKYVLAEAQVAADGTETSPEAAILYGEWINTIVSLIIIGFVMFMIVKAYNKVRAKKEEEKKEDPGPSKEEKLLMEIRDAIKAQN